jgi:AbrB family looped-hinge helix DNA binding protein
MQGRFTSDDAMKEILSTISSKGQITVPAEVRRHLGVGLHDKVAFVIEDKGSVRLTAPHYPAVASLAGAAGSLEKPLSWPEMRRIAREDRLSAKQHREP